MLFKEVSYIIFIHTRKVGKQKIKREGYFLIVSNGH